MKRNGYTIIEVGVVVMVAVLLAMIVVPQVIVSCKSSNLKTGPDIVIKPQATPTTQAEAGNK